MSSESTADVSHNNDEEASCFSNACNEDGTALSDTITNEDEKDNPNQDVNKTGEEDDDFGDFEEAIVTENDSNRAEKDVLKAPENVPMFTAFSRVDDLNILLSDLRLWISDDGEGSATSTDNSIICDIMTKFELCDIRCNDFLDLTSFQAESLKLWSTMCFVEETPALKFLWNKSYAYIRLLEALKIKVRRKSVLGSPSASAGRPSCSSFSSQSKNAQDETKVFSGECIPKNGEMIDSLSVPPVTFDWQSSGLSNPLKGSSISDIAAVLECDFFNPDGPQSTQLGGQSILERELDAMGLNDRPSTNGTSESRAYVNLEDLIRKNAAEDTASVNPDPAPSISPAQSLIKRNKTFHSPEDLSADARALYDQIPDHSYMLAKRLTFPIGDNK